MNNIEHDTRQRPATTGEQMYAITESQLHDILNPGSGYSSERDRRRNAIAKEIRSRPLSDMSGAQIIEPLCPSCTKVREIQPQDAAGKAECHETCSHVLYLIQNIEELQKLVQESQLTLAMMQPPASPGKAGDVLAELEKLIDEMKENQYLWDDGSKYAWYHQVLQNITALRQVQR